MFRKLSIKTSLYTPNFIYYWSDFFGVYPLLRNAVTLRIFLIVLLFTSIAIIKSITQETVTPIRHILPMLRTYLLLEVFIYLFKNTNLSPERLFFYAVLANLIVVLIGQIDISIYRTINNFFNGSQRFISKGSTVASIAATERNSGIFSQPATAGAFCLVTVAVLLNYNFKKLFIFIPIMIYVGLLTKSSAFLYGLLILPIIMLIPHFMLNKFTLLVLLLMPLLLMSVIVGIFIQNQDYFLLYALGGGRFVSESNFMFELINMNFMELLFGIDLEKLNRGLGDSSVVTKIFLGGVPFYILYLVCIFIYAIKIINWNNFKQKRLSFSVLTIISASDLGFTAFSQPGLYMAVFLPLFFGKYNEK